MAQNGYNTEEYDYTYTEEDRARTADWTDLEVLHWIWNTEMFLQKLRTPEERANQLRRKGKYGVWVEYMIQKSIYNNPEAWRHLPEEDQVRWLAGELSDQG